MKNDNTISIQKTESLRIKNTRSNLSIIANEWRTGNYNIPQLAKKYGISGTTMRSKVCRAYLQNRNNLKIEGEVLYGCEQTSLELKLFRYKIDTFKQLKDLFEDPTNKSLLDKFNQKEIVKMKLMIEDVDMVDFSLPIMKLEENVAIIPLFRHEIYTFDQLINFIRDGKLKNTWGIGSEKEKMILRSLKKLIEEGKCLDCWKYKNECKCLGWDKYEEFKNEYLSDIIIK